MGLKILRWDDSIIGNMTPEELEAYVDDRKNFGTIPFKIFEKPSSSWTMPLVTGHKYRVSWGLSGIDFEQMSI